MLSLTGGMKYVYCEGNVSFHYKWDGLESTFTQAQVKYGVNRVSNNLLNSIYAPCIVEKFCLSLQYERRTLEQISYPRESQTEIGKLPTAKPDGSQR